MRFKHVKMVSKNRAEIRLYEEIGEGQSTGNMIASEIEFLTEFAEVTEILVRINSIGGSMVEGFGIFSSLQAAKEKGIKVITRNDGLAASMAGPILLAGDEREMVDFGIVMLHDPTIGGKQDSKTKKMLQKFKEASIKMFTGQTNLTEEEVAKMMSKETWLDAQEALDLGIITTILQTGKNISNEIIERRDVSELLNVCNKLIDGNLNKNQKKNMKKIALALGLPENATEEQIIAAINASKATVTVENANNVDLLMELGRKNGHVTDQNLETYKKIALADFESACVLLKVEVETKAITDVDKKPSTENQPETLTDALKELAKVNSSASNDVDPNDKTKWGFDEYQKKDPKGLLAMKQSKPEEYKALYLAHLS